MDIAFSIHFGIWKKRFLNKSIVHYCCMSAMGIVELNVMNRWGRSADKVMQITLVIKSEDGFEDQASCHVSGHSACKGPVRSFNLDFGMS